MIFSELYSAYYTTVAKILRTAVGSGLERADIRRIVEENAFGESILSIEPALLEQRWQLVLPDGTTPLEHEPTMPVTKLQKQWLKAIYSDPRIRLFTYGVLDKPETDFPDVEPLFRQEDVHVYDKYSDGDPYEDEGYIRNFRLILNAIRNRYPLRIETQTHRGDTSYMIMMPEYLEYSEKDDKFRVVGESSHFEKAVNLARIIGCARSTRPFTSSRDRVETEHGTVVFELTDERNALERVLLHFAHFEKEAERLDGNRYRVTLKYERDDETEILIRILSFGPLVKVTSPQSFINLIRDRLIKQKNCGH